MLALIMAKIASAQDPERCFLKGNYPSLNVFQVGRPSYLAEISEASTFEDED